MIKPENRKISLEELAKLADARVEGDGSVIISGVASISDSVPGQLTFLSGEKNYSFWIESLKSCKASAVIAPEDSPELGIPSIRLKNPYFGLIKALEFFHKKEKPDYSIHSTAFVSMNAKIEPSASIGYMAVIESGAEIGKATQIGANVFIGKNCRIGDNTLIYPGARILDNCIIGSNCIIHANAVIGSDGFGFTVHNGRHLKVPQVGNVIVEDNVEIGACTTIDRGSMTPTIIGSETKIDNLVHIAHNVQIGKNCIIVAMVGISGSTIIEDNVTLAGQVGTVGHLRIGKGSTVAARGVVTSDIKAGSFVSGFPAKPHAEERRIMASMRKLPELLKRVRYLEKKLEVKDNK